MVSDAVKVARINARAIRQAKEMELAKAIITNPVLELIAGIAAITYLNKGNRSWLESISGIDLAAGGEYAGLVAVIGLQQIAPLIAASAGTQSDLAKSILPALPALLAL